LDKIGNEMIAAYEKSLEKFGVTPSALGCPKGRQKIRFNAFKKLIIKDSQLLDFGCGFGDLASYLENNNFPVNYTGCDVMEKFIDVAKIKQPSCRFFNTQFGEELKEEFDIVICSGVFNFLYSKDKEEHFDLVKKTIKNLFSISRHSLIIDFLSENVDFEADNSYHQKTSKLIDFCNKEVSRRYIIDHSYMPYEFLIQIFKYDKIKQIENTFENEIF
jgi:cyclopropane fatty-acyl-phospholipid synthase-like methyltransferase